MNDKQKNQALIKALNAAKAKDKKRHLINDVYYDHKADAFISSDGKQLVYVKRRLLSFLMPETSNESFYCKLSNKGMIRMDSDYEYPAWRNIMDTQNLDKLTREKCVGPYDRPCDSALSIVHCEIFNLFGTVVNYEYLKNLAVVEPYVTIHGKDRENVIEIKAYGDDYRAIIMPMRHHIGA